MMNIWEQMMNVVKVEASHKEPDKKAVIGYTVGTF
jgi:hypothetical protein